MKFVFSISNTFDSRYVGSMNTNKGCYAGIDGNLFDHITFMS